MSYTYDEAEAAAIDLLSDTDEVYYGMVRAVYVLEQNRIDFYDTDSGHAVGEVEEPGSMEAVADMLKLYDQQIREEL